MKKIALILFAMLFGMAANAQNDFSIETTSIPLLNHEKVNRSGIVINSLKYCDYSIATGYRIGDAQQNQYGAIALIGFNINELISYQNYQIDSISIGIYDGSYLINSKIVIKEENKNNSNTYQQNCTLSTGWNTVTLTTPYIISGTKDIYLGYEITVNNTNGSFPIGTTSYSVNDSNSFLYACTTEQFRWRHAVSALNLIAYISPVITGTGTLANPYIIKNNSNLNIVADRVNNGQPNAYIAFYNDSIINGASNTSIGNSTNPFKGKVVFVDGAGNPVNNGSVTINGITNPLFGNTDEATINKITLTGVNINSSSNNVGALVNIANNSIIDSCYSSGTVAGNNNVGGLIGNSNSCSNITNCHSTANVTGVEYVGGLIGKMDGCSVRKSYAIGNVSGNDKVGGLLGSNDRGTVLKCYSKGNVNRLAGSEKLFGKLIGTGAGNEVGCFYLITATSPIDAMSNYRGTASLTPEEALN